MKKYLKLLAACFIFILILFVVYLIHINYFNVEVVLYAAIVDVFIASFISFILVFVILKRYFFYDSFERVLIFCIWLLGGYAFAITGPTILDRSLSFFVLEKIQIRGGIVHIDEIEEIFLEYIPEVRLVDVRLTEQLQSKTVTRVGDCIQLTNRGKRLVGFSRFFRENLLAKNRLLNDEYTDFLTRPNLSGETSNNIRC